MGQCPSNERRIKETCRDRYRDNQCSLTPKRAVPIANVFYHVPLRLIHHALPSCRKNRIMRARASTKSYLRVSDFHEWMAVSFLRPRTVPQRWGELFYCHPFDFIPLSRQANVAVLAFEDPASGYRPDVQGLPAVQLSPRDFSLAPGSGCRVVLDVPVYRICLALCGDVSHEI